MAHFADWAMRATVFFLPVLLWGSLRQLGFWLWNSFPKLSVSHLPQKSPGRSLEDFNIRMQDRGKVKDSREEISSFSTYCFLL